MTRGTCINFQAFLLCFGLLFLCHDGLVVAQNYFGLGVHFDPPVRLDNCCNSYVNAKPILVPAYSISFKGIWETKRKKEWYCELGISTIGLGVNIQNYFNDTVEVWNDFNLKHVGFPSVLFGGGRIFPISGKSSNHGVSLGLEGSFRITHDLGGFFTNTFGLSTASDDYTFPFFLRFNAGYTLHFKWFGQLPSQLHLYSNISLQDIARSPQYIVNPLTGQSNDEGIYQLNNSEIGLKLFTNLEKGNFKFNRKSSKIKAKQKRGGGANFRLSIEGQLYKPPATEYFIPEVDSFSLKGVKFSFTNQIGVKTEIIHFRNENWATVLGIGLGKTTSTTHFRAEPEFTSDGLLIDSPNGGFVGIYLIPNLGLAYKHQLGRRYLQHTFSTTVVLPITKENESIQMVERSFLTLPPHLVPKILDGEINYKYGREKILFGLEYQPELLYRIDKRFFYGLGLVFNYSWGIIAQGRVKVDNGHTKYFGGLTQSFSKIGIMARIGWNSNRHQ